jgi:CheY-like chemotaxis protein
MPVTREHTEELARLESSLRKQYRSRIRNLALIESENGIDLVGEASSYHTVQLAIRDVLANEQFRVRQNRIRVLPAVSVGPHRRSNWEAVQLATDTRRKRIVEPQLQVLLACANSKLTLEIRQLLRSAGFSVETTSSGVDCFLRACKHTPDILLFADTLPWGGVDGVIESLAESGRLGRSRVYYVGSEEGIGLLSEIRCRLNGVRLTSKPNAWHNLIHLSALL